jgi:hypothetical protein
MEALGFKDPPLLFHYVNLDFYYDKVWIAFANKFKSVLQGRLGI